MWIGDHSKFRVEQFNLIQRPFIASHHVTLKFHLIDRADDPEPLHDPGCNQRPSVPPGEGGHHERQAQGGAQQDHRAAPAQCAGADAGQQSAGELAGVAGAR